MKSSQRLSKITGVNIGSQSTASYSLNEEINPTDSKRRPTMKSTSEVIPSVIAYPHDHNKDERMIGLMAAG